LNLVWDWLPAIETKVSHLGADVLIGGDVLDDCLFVRDGPAGRFVLAY
jgi:hypothetical protein